MGSRFPPGQSSSLALCTLLFPLSLYLYHLSLKVTPWLLPRAKIKAEWFFQALGKHVVLCRARKSWPELSDVAAAQHSSGDAHSSEQIQTSSEARNPVCDRWGWSALNEHKLRNRVSPYRDT